jgi:hypothetical protein
VRDGTISASSSDSSNYVCHQHHSMLLTISPDTERPALLAAVAVAVAAVMSHAAIECVRLSVQSLAASLPHPAHDTLTQHAYSSTCRGLRGGLRWCIDMYHALSLPCFAVCDLSVRACTCLRSVIDILIKFTRLPLARTRIIRTAWYVWYSHAHGATSSSSVYGLSKPTVTRAASMIHNRSHHRCHRLKLRFARAVAATAVAAVVVVRLPAVNSMEKFAHTVSVDSRNEQIWISLDDDDEFCCRW